MTDQELNEKIAVICGWKHGREHAKGLLGLDWNHPDGRTQHNPPDYANDLNAMHEVEQKEVIPRDWVYQSYSGALRRMIDPHGLGVYLHHATAQQRAKAFLEVMSA